MSDEKDLPIFGIGSAAELSQQVIAALVELYENGDLEWDMMPLEIDKLEEICRNLPALHLSMAEVIDAYQREIKRQQADDKD